MRHLMIFILENLFRLSNMSNHGRRNFQNLILSFHQLIELVFRVNIIESKWKRSSRPLRTLLRISVTWGFIKLSINRKESPFFFFFLRSRNLVRNRIFRYVERRRGSIFSLFFFFSFWKFCDKVRCWRGAIASPSTTFVRRQACRNNVPVPSSSLSSSYVRFTTR